MERIKLTKDEIRVLRLAEQRYSKEPDDFSRKEYTSLVRRLMRKGLVSAIFSIGDKVSILWLTDVGEEWLSDYERRPVIIPWKTIAGIIAATAALTTILTFVLSLISCSVLLSMAH